MGWKLSSDKRRCLSCQQEAESVWKVCPYCGRPLTCESVTPCVPTPIDPETASPRSCEPTAQGTAVLPPQQRDLPIQSVSDGNVGWLVPLDGPNIGKLFVIGDRVLIGAAEDCSLTIADPALSGRHAEIVLGPQNRYRITDLGSRNGTYVNDRAIVSEDLVDGDNLRMGRTTFRFKSKR